MAGRDASPRQRGGRLHRSDGVAVFSPAVPPRSRPAAKGPVLWVRAPAHRLGLRALVARALAGVCEADASVLLKAKAVRVDGQVASLGSERVAPGARLEIRLSQSKGGGHRDCLDDGAPEFVAEDEAGSRDGDSWRVLVPTLPWRRGWLRVPAGGEAGGMTFERTSKRGAVDELAFTLGGLDLSDALDCLADAGSPVLGDAWRGGIAVAGGLRLLPAAADPVATVPWWPREAVIDGRFALPRPLPTLAVSRSTARIVEAGHPWVLADKATGDAGRFAPGARVALVGPAGERCGEAVIEAAGRDGRGTLVARRWAPFDLGGDRRPREREVEARVEAALARRRAGLRPRDRGRDCALRLVHGEADGLPGIAVDRLGPVLRVLITGRACDGFRERAIAALVAGLKRDEGLGAPTAVVEVVHLRATPRGRLECVRVRSGADALAEAEAKAAALLRECGADPELARGRCLVEERGLRFLAEPGHAQPQRATPGYGLFSDQRQTRAWLAGRGSEGGRWLNLFAHTGAFTAALLAAGASEVVSVDLSASYLRWLEANLALNRDLGVDPARHQSHRGDGRRYLEVHASDESFDGIVIDPPTAAAAGRRYWSVRRDLAPLVGLALRRLRPGGTLMVATHDRRASADALESLVREKSAQVQVRLAKVDAAPPAPDFPELRGFPEGDAFRAVLVDRRG